MCAHWVLDKFKNFGDQIGPLNHSHQYHVSTWQQGVPAGPDDLQEARGGVSVRVGKHHVVAKGATGDVDINVHIVNKKFY